MAAHRAGRPRFSLRDADLAQLCGYSHGSQPIRADENRRLRPGVSLTGWLRLTYRGALQPRRNSPRTLLERLIHEGVRHTWQFLAQRRCYGMARSLGDRYPLNVSTRPADDDSSTRLLRGSPRSSASARLLRRVRRGGFSDVILRCFTTANCRDYSVDCGVRPFCLVRRTINLFSGDWRPGNAISQFWPRPRAHHPPLPKARIGLRCANYLLDFLILKFARPADSKPCASHLS